MRKGWLVALFGGFGLLPVWIGTVWMIAGSFQPDVSKDYWLVAPWLLTAGIYLSSFTLVFAAVVLIVYTRTSGPESRKLKVAGTVLLAGVVALAAGAAMLVR
jgi:hypothetical protein